MANDPLSISSYVHTNEQQKQTAIEAAAPSPALTGTQLIAHIAEGQASLIKEQTNQLRSLIRAMAKVSWGECQVSKAKQRQPVLPHVRLGCMY